MDEKRLRESNGRGVGGLRLNIGFIVIERAFVGMRVKVSRNL